MVRVLCIGLYNGEGKFIKEQWKCFIKWCRIECNKIVIYSPMTYNTVRSKFLSYCNISVLKKPDESLDVYTYEINIIDSEFWNYIEDFNFNESIVPNNCSESFVFNFKSSFVIFSKFVLSCLFFKYSSASSILGIGKGKR